MKKHEVIRSEQRYNKITNKDFILNIIKQIINNEALLIKEQSNNRVLYYAKYKKIPYKIVWDVKKKRIITFLPFDTDEYNDIIKEKNRERKERLMNKKIKLIKCPKCGIIYNAVPQNYYINCLDCGEKYIQKTELLHRFEFIKNYIKNCKGEL